MILYSYRRCPYAMRARMALRYAGIEVEHREIELRNKPQSMLLASPKGTVPVLCMGDRVLDQSVDIMRWAIQQSDPDAWGSIDDAIAQAWIARSRSSRGIRNHAATYGKRFAKLTIPAGGKDDLGGYCDLSIYSAVLNG